MPKEYKVKFPVVATQMNMNVSPSPYHSDKVWERYIIPELIEIKEANPESIKEINFVMGGYLGRHNLRLLEKYNKSLQKDTGFPITSGETQALHTEL